MNKLKLFARWGLKKGRKTAFVRQSWNVKVIDWIGAAIPAILFVCLSIVVYEFGFRPFYSNNTVINFWIKTLLTIISFLFGIKLLMEAFITKKKWVRLFNIVTWLFILMLTFYVAPVKAGIATLDSNRFLIYKSIIYAGILLGFITELSHLLQFVYSKEINPGVLFIGSFSLLIFFGAFMLKLPNATVTHTSNINALFTSASAVCVTGLVVVDTATHFTPFGHFVILLLIQTGGLGFMTFAGLLAYAIAGNTSFKAQLAFTHIMSRSKVSNIINFVIQVVFITFLFEAIGAIFIYLSLNDELFIRKRDKLFFAIFHAVSAFCNAGFSTYSNGLYEPGVRYNYSLQIFVALLVVIGGMGFPIVFNLFKLVKIKTSNLYSYITGKAKRAYLPNVIMLNSRLALFVSAFLLVIGFVAYYIFERSASLLDHPTYVGKIITCFFGSVTPRTAGFNTVDLTTLSLPMIMIYLLLMWIGASPGSTGGGIKTTTAGVAKLNLVSILKGKDRTEFFRSEISFQSISRAFAIIVLSLLFIGTIVFAISVNDSDKGLIKIAFEAFSAFSTVGLSLGITAQLSDVSKMILIFAMFIGRVGAITLLAILIRQSKELHYRYPVEDIAF